MDGGNAGFAGAKARAFKIAWSNFERPKAGPAGVRLMDEPNNPRRCS